jgi:beta-lactamase regulating signal transducer with metallopeptidase domain
VIEATFPLLGTAFVVLIVLPVFALLGKMGLVTLERAGAAGPLHGLNLRYVLLTGSSVLPIAWLLSAGLHQAETVQSSLACLFDHDTAELCFEPGVFALVLAAAVLASSLRVLRGRRAVRGASSDAARAVQQRVANIVANDAALGLLRDRVIATDDDGVAVGTQGLLRPRVFVGTAFAARLSNEMLACALGHEAEHVRALDPLRYLILELALAMNPFGRFLLESHAARWYAAREAHCDREAVILGAAPLPLAAAIVRAARPGAREAVALGARDTAVLKFRIGMLLAFAERAPTRCCHHGLAAPLVALVLLLIALLLPQQTGTAALDALHTGAERALTYFWR